MSNFQRTENIGREKFSSWLDAIKATDIQFTEDEYCAVDCTFKYNNISYAVEIKVRDERYKDYPTHMLEQGKLNGMIDYKNANGLDVMIYANFFGDYLYLYKLGNKYDTESLMLARTTAEDNGYRSKEIIWLSSSTAIKYHNNGLKWEVSS